MISRFRSTARFLLSAAGFAYFAAPRVAEAAQQIPVMVIATYETGKDRGDTPGELQFWVERQDLTHEIKVAGVDHPLLTNGRGLYAMVSGTTSRCAVQLMALAADPRFDLTHTYFVLCGIGGAFPKVMSLGERRMGSAGDRRQPGLRDRQPRNSGGLAQRARGHRGDEAR